MTTPKLLSTDSRETLEMNVWLAVYTSSVSRGNWSIDSKNLAEASVKQFTNFFNLGDKE